MPRSLKDSVEHWWPGYWSGYREGCFVGASLAVCGFALWFAYSGC